MGKLQNEDFKTEAELTGAGGSKSQLLNDTKIYVTGNGINKTLDDAIVNGDIGGGSSESIFNTSSNYTILDGDGYTTINVTDTTATRTVTLPTAADNTSRFIRIKNSSTQKGTVTVDGEGAETIDGFTTINLDFKGCFVCVQSDGTNWQVVSDNITKPYKSYSITVTGTNWSTLSARATPFRDMEGKWRMIFNIYGFFTVTGVGASLDVTGATWASESDQSIHATQADTTTGFLYRAIAEASTDKLSMANGDLVQFWRLGGNIELSSKPTFVE